MTSIEFENEYGRYTISMEEDIVQIDNVMQELVKPLLLAAGFQPESVSEYIPD